MIPGGGIAGTSDPVDVGNRCCAASQGNIAADPCSAAVGWGVDGGDGLGRSRDLRTGRRRTPAGPRLVAAEPWCCSAMGT